MMQKQDASVMLKEEVNESLLRLKAAKFGKKISSIAPQYTNSFYLPEKTNFEVKTPKIEDLRFFQHSNELGKAINSAGGGRGRH